MAYILYFLGGWLGIMAIIGLAVVITYLFGKNKSGKKESPQEYARRFEEELAEKTPEKPINKALRNPFFMSQDEIDETLKGEKK